MLDDTTFNPEDYTPEELRIIGIELYGGREPGRMNRAITLDYGFKRCSRCREWMPLTKFGMSKGRADGYNNKCKKCANGYLDEWHAKPENAGK